MTGDLFFLKDEEYCSAAFMIVPEQLNTACSDTIREAMESIRRGRCAITEFSWTNTDDRLSLDALGSVEGGDGIVEGNRVAGICPQPTMPEPLDDPTQLGAIGFDDEVDSLAARGPRLP